MTNNTHSEDTMMITILDTSICWTVLAPLPVAKLEHIAKHRWENQSPYASDSPPWEVVAGTLEYNALVSRSPGGEGSDHYFAESLSRLAQDKVVYLLWFDPEYQRVFEWKNGCEVASCEDDPLSIAESLGFEVSRQAVSIEKSHSVVVVEGASIGEVRHALGKVVDEGWLHVTPGLIGVMIITAADGSLSPQAWDVAESLPLATVYDVQQRPEAFRVRVLDGSEEVGQFRVPALDDDTPMLSDIKGATTPSAIMEALGIPPDALRDSYEATKPKATYKNTKKAIGGLDTSILARYSPTDEANSHPDWVKKQFPEYISPHSGHEATSIREFSHNGHNVKIITTYRVEVDGQPIRTHFSVDEDGRVYTHATPFVTYASANDLMKAVIDYYPESFSSIGSKAEHQEHERHQ